MHKSFFLENSFQKNKILTSLEAILERFVFLGKIKMLKFGVLKIELLMLGKTDLQKQSSTLVLEIELGLKYSVFW
ncbi:hypothetical protein MASR1M104_24670 [Cloacibacterium normanense]